MGNIFSIALFGIPLSICLATWISAKFFKNDLKYFYGIFYGSILLSILILGISYFHIIEGIDVKISLANRMLILPFMLSTGFGLCVTTLCLIKPLQFSKVFKENKNILIGFFVVIALIRLLSIFTGF